MAFKEFTLADGTPVKIYKRKGSRNLRLSVSVEGLAKVSIPRWSAYAAGLRFAQSRADWIKAQQQTAGPLKDGQQVGKAHRLRFSAGPDVKKTAGRVQQTEIIIYYPIGQAASSRHVQEAARRACVRALRLQAESLLPRRVDSLAGKYGFTYNKLTIKQMKSRWGSCDRHRNIVLNLFLMQLPWQQIDYVILHELTHTEVLRHGPDFWQAMERVLPDVKQRRRDVRGSRPWLHAPAETVA